MLDKFVYGDVSRISPEGPAPVFKQQVEVLARREKIVLGGAGNVAQNLKSLGVDVMLISTVGEDEEGRILTQLLDNEDITYQMHVCGEKLTTVKTRFIASGQQVMRLDVENTDTIPFNTQKDITAYITKNIKNFDVIILCDYNKGMLSHGLCQDVIIYGNGYGKKVIVDPKGTDYTKYTDAFLVKPNHSEFYAALGNDRSINDLRIGHRIQHLVVTLGGDGMQLMNDDGIVKFPIAEPKDVCDVTGAGDTAIAMLAVCLAADYSLANSIKLANVAAGIVVQKQGTASVTTQEIISEMNEPDRPVDIITAKTIANVWRSDFKKVGFTNGCFDLIHPGHVSLLAEAKRCCDKLIVGINSDASVKRLKGKDRPLQDQHARACVLLALESVDLVVIFDQDDPLTVITKIKPDVLFKGADYTIDQVIGAQEVHVYGGEVILIPLKGEHSTTNIVKKME